MPWIDPKKEAESLAILEDNTYMSGPEIIRRRGASPRDVLDQQSQWERDKRRWGIAPRAAAPATAPQPPLDEEEEEEEDA
jgi:capsid protein